MDVVDLCSGDGWFTLQIAKIARMVTAIDIDGKLLDVARRRLTENDVLNCIYIEGDAYEIASVVRHPVDFVFLANAFHGVPDPLRLSLAVKAVLKIGGRFAIVNWHQRPREETIVLGERAVQKPNLESRRKRLRLGLSRPGFRSLARSKYRHTITGAFSRGPQNDANRKPQCDPFLIWQIIVPRHH